MMKGLFHKMITWLPAVVCMMLMSACIKESMIEEGPDGALMLQPGVVCLDTKTTTPGDDDRGENALGTYLDVFFTGSGHSFWKEYHLSNRTFDNVKGELLSVNWRADGFDATKNYNVYVVVNGPAAAHATVGSFIALQAIAYTDANIYQLQRKTGDRPVEAPHAYTDGSKRFMMDGFLENWSPDGSKTVQTIDMRTSLKRAAAKIVVNITYDSDFLDEIIDDEKTPGEPRFKFNNYATCSTAIADGSAIDPALTTTSGWRRLNDFADGVYEYSLTTYSYAYSWASSIPAVGLDAPYILLSIPMGDDPATTVNHYYRIPVRPDTEYSLDRNYIYTVNVELNSLGSYKEADAGIPVNLSYEVLPWTIENSEVTNVRTTIIHYFDANPSEIALHGEGTQTATIRYHSPANGNITIEVIPEASLYAAGATVPDFTASPVQASGDYEYQAFYINKSAVATKVTGDVTIDLSTTNQVITVNSTVLANRASKYIRFRVWYDKGESWQTYKDIYIRHFPTDNIDHIPGHWSSRWSEDYMKQFTFDWNGQGWEKYDGIEPDYTLCSGQAEYLSATGEKTIQMIADGNYSAGAWKEYSHNVSREEWVAAVANRGNGINSENNASHGAGEYLPYWYWGTESTELAESNWFGDKPSADQYDWRTGIGGLIFPYHYHYWSTIHKYWYVQGFAKRFWRYYPLPIVATTGNWADYVYQNGKTVVSDALFTAKIFINNQCRNFTKPENQPINYNPTETSTLSNNQMYVIQLTASSDQYVLGRPHITDYQSNDHVISPAFMLASQLGAVASTTDSHVAAAHCGTYMEVGQDGTRYVDWRLPTAEEIDIIINYQTEGKPSAEETIATVLSGAYYWTLDGTSKQVTGGDGGSSTNAYTRCIRDLSAAEVEKLNRIK